MGFHLIFLIFVGVLDIFTALPTRAENRRFHSAPPSSDRLKNPYAGQPAAIRAGAELYAVNCSTCHGQNGKGMGNVPALSKGPTQLAPDGEVFWFITTGSVENGMPKSILPIRERWQIVSYLKSLVDSHSSEEIKNEPHSEITPRNTDTSAPQPPFTDFRFEKPGNVHKITSKDLPPPYLTKSASNGPQIVDRPKGFRVREYVTGLVNPRLIRTAPNGDFFVAESSSGEIKVFRGITDDGKPKQMRVFATGLNQPYGLAFYPPGNHPQWLYVGTEDSVVRLPYQNGNLISNGQAERIAELPHEGGHWTRDIQFSMDGKKMYVSVGSASNADDPDTHSREKNRADILEFNPDGSGIRVYAYGIRNAGGGLAIQPRTGKLWCSVNERDGLGDNLVPDYITHIEEGGFYGWPWWYMGGNQDPRYSGKHPELREKVITPDVLIQPHNATLQMTFYESSAFPSEYRGDIFASQHGSWNRSVRTGYEVIRVPLHHTERATGEYEDFLTGFVVDNERVWGRPVGITVTNDGSLLVTDDGSNSIWLVSYIGK